MGRTKFHFVHKRIIMTTSVENSDLSRAWQAVGTVVDPEIPVVSVVEMGMIPDVAVVEDAVTVELAPTFAGCPALDMIRGQIIEAVLGAGFHKVDVRVVFDPPWSTERITEVGRRKLKEFGLAPPTRCHGSPVSESMLHQVACPYCDSGDTTLESIFGPTLCRAIHYCNSCRQSFEQFKPV